MYVLFVTNPAVAAKSNKLLLPRKEVNQKHQDKNSSEKNVGVELQMRLRWTRQDMTSKAVKLLTGV